MIVRELLTKLGFQVNDQKLKKYEQSTNNIKRSANDAANVFRGMFASFVGFQGLQALANTADEMQSLEARISKLPQTVGASGDAFDVVAARASNAKQGISEYASFYIKAANATQDFITNQKDVLNVVDGVAFGLAASGANAASQSQAFFQLGQAIGSPTVQMEEMNTLIDVAPDLFRALGKAIPGANGNLKKFIGTGSVTGKMLAEGLVKVLPQFEAQMKSMPMSIGTAGVLINNRWSLFIAKLNRKSGTVTKVADFLIKGFDKVEKGLDILVEKLGGAKQAVKLFGIVLAAALAPLVAGGLVSALAWLFSPVGLLIAGLILLGIVIEDVWTYMQGGESVTGRLVEWFNRASDGAKAFKVALGLLLIPFYPLIMLGYLLYEVLGLIKSMFVAIKNWVDENNILGKMGDELDLIVKGLAVLYDVFKSTFDFMKSLSNITWDDIGNGFSKMVDKMKEKWDFLKWGLALNPIGAVGVGIGQMIPSNSTNSTSSQNVTINQEYAKDTPHATMADARLKTLNAVNEANKQARQMGQAQ